jgi:hypothetical protein
MRGRSAWLGGEGPDADQSGDVRETHRRPVLFADSDRKGVEPSESVAITINANGPLAIDLPLGLSTKP